MKKIWAIPTCWGKNKGRGGWGKKIRWQAGERKGSSEEGGKGETEVEEKDQEQLKTHGLNCSASRFLHRPLSSAGLRSL